MVEEEGPVQGQLLIKIFQFSLVIYSKIRASTQMHSSLTAGKLTTL